MLNLNWFFLFLIKKNKDPSVYCIKIGFNVKRVNNKLVILILKMVISQWVSTHCA